MFLSEQHQPRVVVQAWGDVLFTAREVSQILDIAVSSSWSAYSRLLILLTLQQSNVLRVQWSGEVCDRWTDPWSLSPKEHSTPNHLHLNHICPFLLHGSLCLRSNRDGTGSVEECFHSYFRQKLRLLIFLRFTLRGPHKELWTLYEQLPFHSRHFSYGRWSLYYRKISLVEFASMVKLSTV